MTIATDLEETPPRPSRRPTAGERLAVNGFFGLLIGAVLPCLQDATELPHSDPTSWARIVVCALVLAGAVLLAMAVKLRLEVTARRAQRSAIAEPRRPHVVVLSGRKAS